MIPARILVVEDDADHLDSLCDLLAAAGHAPEGVSDPRAALDAARAAPPDLVLSDLRMPGLDGIALLDALRGAGARMPVVLLTGHGDVAHAVRAMRAGAEDFLEKPYDADHLLSVVDRALSTGRLRAEVARLQDRLAEFDDFVGDSRAVAALRRRLAELAPLDIDVVLAGETGTGKELAARLLHRLGPRGTGPFVVVNCATLPAIGAEAVLFGAPGDAAPGLIAAAEGGTLLLDHVDTLAPPLQPMLLRVLQARAIETAAGIRPVDLRVVATATRPLAEAMRDGAFREDLYFRLASYELTLPPLREIPGDVPLLFERFLSRAAARHGRPVPETGIADRRALQAHHWPGNVHELRTVAERYVLGLARPAPEGARPGQAGAAATLRDLVAEFETREIARVLDACDGNTRAAARILGIPRRTLSDKIARSPLLRGE